MVATSLFVGVNRFFLSLIGEDVQSIHQSMRPEPPMFERDLISFPEAP